MGCSASADLGYGWVWDCEEMDPAWYASRRQLVEHDEQWEEAGDEDWEDRLVARHGVVEPGGDDYGSDEWKAHWAAKRAKLAELCPGVTVTTVGGYNGEFVSVAVFVKASHLTAEYTGHAIELPEKAPDWDQILAEFADLVGIDEEIPGPPSWHLAAGFN